MHAHEIFDARKGNALVIRITMWCTIWILHDVRQCYKKCNPAAQPFKPPLQNANKIQLDTNRHRGTRRKQ